MFRAMILLAEDSDDDALLIQRALEKAPVPCSIVRVENGEEAISYFKGESEYVDRESYPKPDLLLLDLKMPRKDGFEVLQWIRQQPELKTLRVIVLTASDQIKDVNKAYALGANSFLVKPLDFQDLKELGRVITDYWLRLDIGSQRGVPTESLEKPNLE